MTFIPTNPEAGIQPIQSAATTGTVNHPLGTQVDAYDSTGVQGACKFIYLYGVASNIVGALVTYNASTGLPTLAPNTAHLGQPLAVSMNANTSLTTGSWYQIGGVAIIKKTATKVSPAVPIFLSGTAGRIFATATSGKQVLNAVSVNAATVASATSTVNVQMQYPFAQGQVI
jgi:hypothetical protein